MKRRFFTLTEVFACFAILAIFSGLCVGVYVLAHFIAKCW
jgi:hypothetical protein